MGTYTRNDLTRILGLAVAYVMLAKMTVFLFGSNNVVNFAWIANGVGLAIISVYGIRILPAVFIGLLLGFLAIGQTFGISLSVSVRNTAAIMLGIWALQREGRFNPVLGAPSDYARILGLARRASISFSYGYL